MFLHNDFFRLALQFCEAKFTTLKLYLPLWKVKFAEAKIKIY